MRVEKWQALGNDYLIVEAGELPWPLTPARIRKICDPHLGMGSDGILLLSPSEDPQYVAALRIFNPDGSESELSGNGSAPGDDLRAPSRSRRQRRLCDPDRSRADPGADHRPIERGGRSRARGDQLTGLSLRRRRRARSARRRRPAAGASSTSRSATLSVRSTARSWRRSIWPRSGRRSSTIRCFPNSYRHQRLLVSRAGAGLDPRPDLRARRSARRSRRGPVRGGAAIAHHLAGGPRRIVVHLDGGELTVEVGEDLHVTLTGWAVPVFASTLAEDFRKELDETQ